MTKNPFRYFKTSPVIMQLTVMMYVRFPLSLRNVEDLLQGNCQRKACFNRPALALLNDQKSFSLFQNIA